MTNHAKALDITRVRNLERFLIDFFFHSPFILQFGAVVRVLLICASMATCGRSDRSGHLSCSALPDYRSSLLTKDRASLASSFNGGIARISCHRIFSSSSPLVPVANRALNPFLKPKQSSHQKASHEHIENHLSTSARRQLICSKSCRKIIQASIYNAEKTKS